MKAWNNAHIVNIQFAKRFPIAGHIENLTDE